MKDLPGDPKLHPQARTNLLKNIPAPLGELLDWPEVFAAYPLLRDVPVVPTLPEKEKPRWTRAATLVRKDPQSGGFDPRSRIIIHPTKEKYPNSLSLLRSLLHEVCHLIQYLDGRWNGENMHHQTENYDQLPLEKEARNFAKKHTLKRTGG